MSINYGHQCELCHSRQLYQWIADNDDHLIVIAINYGHQGLCELGHSKQLYLSITDNDDNQILISINYGHQCELCHSRQLYQ